MAPKTGSRYAALIGGSAQFAGVDQGIDFTGPGPVYALGPGQVTRVETSGSGWPGQGAVLDYLLTGGPAKGSYVYVAEDFAPAQGINPGTPVEQGQVLGYATGSGQAPGIEVGWAQPSGLPVAPLLPRGSNYAASGEPEGETFLQFVESGASTAPPPSSGSITITPGLPKPPTTFVGTSPGSTEANKLLADFGQGAENVATQNPIVQAGRDVVGGAQTAINTVTGIISWLTNPTRILQLVLGGALVLLGLYLLARNSGVVPSAVPVPV